MSKKLIINADDYGICKEVNTAIEHLITAGRLQNVSVLANSEFYEQSVGFLLNHRDCSVGIHLNTVEGIPLLSTDKAKPLVGNDGRFVNLGQLLMRWIKAPFAVSKAVEAEWRAQIELLLNSGLKITHADSHQHIHAFPPFWKLMVKLCSEYEIAAVRLPKEQNNIGLRRIPALALNNSAAISRMFSASQNLSVNHHFLGFKRAGSYGENEMISDLPKLKEGVTELVIHPSINDGIPYSAMRGKLEFEALAGSKLWNEIAELKIELLTWSEFARNQISKN